MSVWAGAKHDQWNDWYDGAHMHDEESHIADFFAKQVVAHKNGGNGLNFHSQETMQVDQRGRDFHGGSKKDYIAHPLATVYGGSFNNNAMSGINMNVRTLRTGLDVFGSLIQVDQAIAKRNGQNGLGIFGGVPDGYVGFGPRAIHVDVVGGVFNRNGVDGVHMSNVAHVNLDRPVGVANRDDGFEGFNVGDVEGDWTFVANFDEDFVVNNFIV